MVNAINAELRVKPEEIQAADGKGFCKFATNRSVGKFVS
jgi:hypothetical protein